MCSLRSRCFCSEWKVVRRVFDMVRHSSRRSLIMVMRSSQDAPSRPSEGAEEVDEGDLLWPRRFPVASCGAGKQPFIEGEGCSSENTG